MRKVIDDPRLMVRVCDLYYNQGISQQQIAKDLNLSRPTVSRVLALAREQGIVKISISNVDAVEHWELERKLEKEYGLQEVIIVGENSSEDKMKEALGEAAARYLEYTIKDGNTVGVSMGSTLYEVISHVMHPEAKRVTFVPIVGGVGSVSSRNIREELLKEETLLPAIRLTQKLDIAVVGIGYPNEKSAIMATGYFKENEIDSLINRKVAGELCMQFYDIKGDTSPYEDDNNVIGMDISKLRTVPRSIGIAGGIEKLRAIRGAINGHYINTLITDIQCAEALISE